MKNNTRKFLCLLLSIMMVFSLLSVNAFAAEEDLSVAGEDFFVEEEAELAVPFPEEEGAEVVLPEEPAEEDLAQSEEAELTISDVEEEGAAENANAAGSGTCGDNVAWELSDDGVLTITGTGAMADYYNSMLIPWYSSRNDITSVVIESGVTSIGRFAFYGVSLASITIPASVASVGEAAFQNCSSLKTVLFQGSAPSFYSIVFGSVTATAYYPAGDTTWTDEVRQDYGGTITWVVGGKCGDAVCWRLDGDVLTIFGTGSMRNYAMAADLPWKDLRNSISSVVIENGVSTIGTHAFYYCKALTSITIPDSVTKISFSAFEYCDALTNIVIPDSVTDIDMAAFRYCTALTSVTIPNLITSIDNYAFSYCTNLAIITFSGSAPTIGENAFENVTAAVFYPAGDATWTEEVRQDYGGTITWANGRCGDSVYWRLDENLLTIFGTGAMENYGSSDDIPWYRYKSRITSAVIESGVTSIGDRAFYYCNSMTSVTIPDGVTNIGTRAFMYCISLADTTIPDSVTSIGDYAFDNNNSLINLIIPENVTSIGDYAFFYCLGLTSVTVGSGVTSIGAGAFGQCASLTSITFEGSAPTFGGSNVFYNITATAYYPAGDATWTEAVRQNYGGTITWANGRCGDSVFWRLEGDVLTIYGEGAMWDLSSFNLSPWNDFKEGIISVIIENGVTKIGAYAFSEHSSMKTVTIPSSVTLINSYAFIFCNSLTDVTIQDGVRIIGNQAFGYCTALTSVTIPASVAQIYKFVFSNCTAMTEITFLGSAPSFLENVFKDVTATAYYPANDTTWTEAVRQNYGGMITWKPVAEPIEIKLDKTSAKIATNAALQLTAAFIPEYASSVITWTSSNEGIASVDGNGLVTARKYGKTTITAETENGLKATCEIQTRFYDVNSPGKSYYTPVYWAVDKGITVCTVNFRPNDSVNRGEFTAFLYRLAGKPKVSKITTKFTDVNESTKFAKEISWAVEKGVINGYSDGTFRSTDTITRAQVAIMLWRYAGRPSVSTKTSPFPDVKANNSDTSKAIIWGNKNGIIKGSQGYFLPKEKCTRGNVVTFLYRYDQKFG